MIVIVPISPASVEKNRPISSSFSCLLEDRRRRMIFYEGKYILQVVANSRFWRNFIFDRFFLRNRGFGCGRFFGVTIFLLQSSFGCGRFFGLDLFDFLIDDFL